LRALFSVKPSITRFSCCIASGLHFVISVLWKHEDFVLTLDVVLHHGSEGGESVRFIVFIASGGWWPAVVWGNSQLQTWDCLGGLTNLLYWHLSNQWTWNSCYAPSARIIPSQVKIIPLSLSIAWIFSFWSRSPVGVDLVSSYVHGSYAFQDRPSKTASWYRSSQLGCLWWNWIQYNFAEQQFCSRPQRSKALRLQPHWDNAYSWVLKVFNGGWITVSAPKTPCIGKKRGNIF